MEEQAGSDGSQQVFSSLFVVLGALLPSCLGLIPSLGPQVARFSARPLFWAAAV